MSRATFFYFFSHLDLGDAARQALFHPLRGRNKPIIVRLLIARASIFAHLLCHRTTLLPSHYSCGCCRGSAAVSTSQWEAKRVSIMDREHRLDLRSLLR